MITNILAIIAAISAAAILFVKEVFHAALLLLITLLCVAGIFVTINSEFLAVVQILIYAGGVMLLIVFGIMLTVRSKPVELPNADNKIVSGLFGASLFAMLVYTLGERIMPTPTTSIAPEEFGTLLMTRFAIPFEVAGMLLLVSLVGAIVAATQGKES
ncbi:MAG TPA: NADH-quinone oxidoreductase subunit J [Cyclobacteriaceae bacterium]|nr:NADH-quinone oxidoreductase subunit J [Cyclobacteriaceae bacterium]